MASLSRKKTGVKKDLSAKRKTYSGKEIPDQKDPFKLFHLWFKEAEKVTSSETNAMVVATVNKKGQPSARYVLLKSFDSNGFIFFTNKNSKKGSELKNNPKIAALFYWHELHKQIRIEGTVVEVSRKEIENYFYSRPIDSQRAAAISKQSDMLSSRTELKKAFLDAQKSGNSPCCPVSWTGYRIIPEYFEFWSGMPNRLHDRMMYRKIKNSWKKMRLWP